MKNADPDRSHFNFGSSRSLCDHFLRKNMGKFLLDRREPDSQIKKISTSGFKNFGTGAESESEKMTPATSGSHAMLSVTYQQCSIQYENSRAVQCIMLLLYPRNRV